MMRQSTARGVVHIDYSVSRLIPGFVAHGQLIHFELSAVARPDKSGPGTDVFKPEMLTLG
jgi:hypothetical protein